MDKILTNDFGKVVIFVVVFVLGTKLFALVPGGVGPLIPTLWIVGAAIAGILWLKDNEKPAWSVGVYVFVAMYPMGYIEFSLNIFVTLAVMIVSIYVVRSLQKQNVFVGVLGAIILALALPFISTVLIDNLPTGVGGNYTQGI